MTLLQARKIAKTLSILILSATLLTPSTGVFAENGKKPEPLPLTTNNIAISKHELEYLIEPLTKDDLLVEAGGWLQILKKHVGKVSETQIQTLTSD